MTIQLPSVARQAWWIVGSLKGNCLLAMAAMIVEQKRALAGFGKGSGFRGVGFTEENSVARFIPLVLHRLNDGIGASWGIDKFTYRRNTLVRQFHAFIMLSMM